MTTELTVPEQKSPEEQNALTLSEQAKALVIVTNEDRVNAETLLENLSAAEKAVFGYLDPPRAKAYENYQYHLKRFNDAIDPIKQAKKDAKGKCITFDQEQERIRREAQAKAEAEARKRAEDEALAAALQAEQEGDKETAEAILAEPITPPPVVVPKTAPAASRLSAGRSTWSAEVVSLMALVKAVAEGKQPITLLLANETALNGMARSLKSSLSIPGVKAVERKV